MSVKELKAKWQRLFGAAAPNNSRPFLDLRLGYRIRELAYGGPSQSTIRMLDALADEYCGNAVKKPVLIDPRKPMPVPSSSVNGPASNTRDGRARGFEYQGRRYKSCRRCPRHYRHALERLAFFGLRTAEKGA